MALELLRRCSRARPAGTDPVTEAIASCGAAGVTQRQGAPGRPRRPRGGSGDSGDVRSWSVGLCLLLQTRPSLLDNTALCREASVTVCMSLDLPFGSSHVSAAG